MSAHLLQRERLLWRTGVHLARLRQQIEGSREVRADTNRAEIAPIRSHYSINSAALTNGSNRPVDQSEIQLLELGVEFEGAKGNGSSSS